MKIMSLNTALLAVPAVVAAILVAAPSARAETSVYGPYYGPHGGRAGAVVHQNPVTGNTQVVWGAEGPNGYWAGGHTSVYHGACGTAWRSVHRGPNGVFVRRGAVGNGAC
jgi:hypothetical protein